MNLFQSIVLAIFGLLAITAVIIFSMQSSGSGQLNFAGEFTVWGTLPADGFSKAVELFNNDNKKFYAIKYVEKNAQTFQGDLVSALAAGDGPDLLILPETLVVQNLDKVQQISFTDYSLRNFSDTFVDGASIFLTDQGALGVPLLVDPLVMFWNKDIFSTGAVATYPTKWSEFTNLAGRLTSSDRAGNISQGTVALGSYANIDHVKDILSALFLQSGNNIVKFKPINEYDSIGVRWPLNIVFDKGNKNDTESAINFFLDFSNPAKKVYSWNVAMPNSSRAFSGGSLAVYFGRASDFLSIQKSNPHLNFGVAEFPQRDNDRLKVTFGGFYAAAVTRGTKNSVAAKQIALYMATSDFAKLISEGVYMPPARRDLLSLGSLDPVMSVFDSSAIFSKSWLDPSPYETDRIYQEMTESILSGVKKTSEAIDVASQKLLNLIKK